MFATAHNHTEAYRERDTPPHHHLHHHFSTRCGSDGAGADPMAVTSETSALTPALAPGDVILSSVPRNAAIGRSAVCGKAKPKSAKRERLPVELEQQKQTRTQHMMRLMLLAQQKNRTHSKTRPSVRQILLQRQFCNTLTHRYQKMARARTVHKIV
eukprot:m.325469 g.325469  ORF g.325469 m.325469 type:complete len:156 (+) comp27649_c1_seq1:266-733(+)